jgi:hypothetical protein
MTKAVRLLLVLVAVFGVASAAFAAPIPLAQQIAYSGFLVDAFQNPINAPTNLTFKIYDVDTGGVALWTETQTAVPFTDGEFTVNLGSITPFAGAVDFTGNNQLYLGITVGSSISELMPRKKLLYVPYAFRSDIETRATDPSSPVPGQIWLIYP